MHEKRWRLWASDSFSNEKEQTISFPEGMEVSTTYRCYFFLNFDTLSELFWINHNIYIQYIGVSRILLVFQPSQIRLQQIIGIIDDKNN